MYFSRLLFLPIGTCDITYDIKYDAVIKGLATCDTCVQEVRSFQESQTYPNVNTAGGRTNFNWCFVTFKPPNTETRIFETVWYTVFIQESNVTVSAMAKMMGKVRGPFSDGFLVPYPTEADTVPVFGGIYFSIRYYLNTMTLSKKYTFKLIIHKVVL